MMKLCLLTEPAGSTSALEYSRSLQFFSTTDEKPGISPTNTTCNLKRYQSPRHSALGFYSVSGAQNTNRAQLLTVFWN